MSLTSVSSGADTKDAQIVGYVEGRSAQEFVGWTWLPGSDERLTVELRLGDGIIAATLADEGREDLSRNGIGDGRHGFRIEIPEDARDNSDSLKVYASGQSSTAVLLGSASATAMDRESLAKLQRGFELLLGSQRVLHRNIQAVLLKQSPSVDNAVSDISTAQDRLSDAIATLETFLARIETMGNNRDGVVQGKRPPSSIVLKTFIGALLLGLLSSCIALWRCLKLG